MYLTVPIVWPVAVSRVEVVILAMPKSITRAEPSAFTRTLDGFMSRWTTPRAWASSSALRTSMAIDALVCQSSFPRVRIRRSQVCPATSCMASTRQPWSCPKL